MTGAPLDRARVAELIVTRDGERHRGSGYRVRAGAVLTAAHVVDGASSVRVRFEPDLPGEWSVDATSWWADPVADVAVVTIDGRESVAPVTFGRIDDRAAVLVVEAVGFPRWKMRADAAGQRYRDSVHVHGTVAVLSNWREGTLEVVVEPAGAVVGDVSPWQGMSGAALWAAGHVVGVVAKHHPGDGLGRLAASRLDLALDSAAGTSLREALDVRAPLPDVLPAPRTELITNAYQALVADAAPEQLHERTAELAELARFCAGDEPYLWWQAGPWAGKSALLAWFALHPPDGVDVVSFFVTGRWAGQSDSDAFTEALIDQLASLVGEPVDLALEARARRGHLLRLLTTAAAVRPLLLVVDGLDEDTSRADGVARPSIAALLPRRPPPGLRVLVASRPHPGLPDDVPGDHPLRTVMPRPLAVSPHARNIETEAKRELTTLLARPGPHRGLLGLITASGGGLTHPDLEELTGSPSFELDAVFGGVFGRSVGARGTESSERVYLFTHDTLREQAERAYGNGIARYREQIHAWADDHRARGWTADTPGYLFRGYPRLLAALGDTGRLVAFALDRPRHDRMLVLTGGDALALTEIESAAALLAREREPDLLTMLRVARMRWELGRRNDHVPSELPAVWARLGELDRAVALAHSMGNVDRCAEAFTKIVAVLGDENHRLVDDAEKAVMRTIEPHWRYQALLDLAAALPWGERARRMLADVEAGVPAVGGRYRDDLWAALSRQALARADDDEAERFALAVEDFYERDRLLEKLVSDARPDLHRALRFVLLAASDYDLFEWTEELAREAVAAGDDAGAFRIAQESGAQDSLLAELVAALLKEGELVRAGRLALRVETPGERALALCAVAHAHLAAGQTEEAERLAALAGATLPGIANQRGQVVLLTELAALVPGRAAEFHRAADAVVERLGARHNRAIVLAEIASVAARTGDPQRFADCADRAAELAEQAELLVELAKHAVVAADHGRARRLIESAWTPPMLPTGKIEGVLEFGTVRVASRMGAVDLVLHALKRRPADLLVQLLADAPADRALSIAEVIARHLPYQTASDQIPALAELREDDLVLSLAAQTGAGSLGGHVRAVVEAATAAGEDDRALRLAAGMDSEYERSSALLDSCMSVLHDLDRAVRYASAIENVDLRDSAFLEMAHVADDHTRALGLLQEVSGPHRPAGLATLASAAADAGDLAGARTLCVAAENAARAEGAERPELLHVDLADALAWAGDVGRAERVGRTVLGPTQLAVSLLNLARIALSAGDVDRARALAVEVAAFERDEDFPLFGLVDTLMSTGEQGQVERIAGEIEVLSASCTDVFQRDGLRATLAGIVAKLGRHEEALALAGEIGGEPERFEAWTAIARAVPNGQVRAAVRTAILDLTGDLSEFARDYRCKYAVRALAAVGEHEHALSVVGGCELPEHQADAFAALVGEPVAGREDRRALFELWEAVLAGVTDDYHRDYTYFRFAVSRYRQGDHEDAVRLAGLIVDPAARHEVLRTLRLWEMADGRQTADARRFLAGVLATDQWRKALPSVAKLDRGALQRFADEVLG
ncbi:trypsin-like peptidase domain-containing protein [Lentzea sp. BCCO 10_0061]|uniref:Trypsin-like peptidase domain-containing protein n=1 Tax=Lentzea sokolovensis TaxID=3095429 RepID=A0ABU4V1N6_9PSEU|nr:trypsin-like peptidase domain-containing protein [Lentzea sp. BCCO 10_0061]MDX8145693.1 trypsin-like peptidase domain-containing protein [Lentzea sp. BCCO 10_0061]